MKRFQLFIRGIMTNWTGTVGVALTTSAFILFVFFELLQVAGILTNSYVGLISYMALPALFLLGLILVPLGWWQFRRATGRSTKPASWPAPGWIAVSASRPRISFMENLTSWACSTLSVRAAPRKASPMTLVNTAVASPPITAREIMAKIARIKERRWVETP